MAPSSEQANHVRILPVVDLKDGLVVRGVGGRRDEYRPIESQLCGDARPKSVCRALSDAGFSQLYVADLDAIASGDPTQFLKYASGIFSRMGVVLDAGLRSAEQARRLAEAVVDGRPLAGIVAGLETLYAPHTLAEFVQIIGPERLVFSLDLKAGRPLTEAGAWQGLAPLAIARIALRAGVRRMIVLDLARVGMGGGVGTEPLCRQLRCLDPTLEIIAGGGVRAESDLESLSRAGCDAALVASALHDGRLVPTELATRWRLA